MHKKSPSVMAFCLVCLGILAKNMPKRLAGYYLLNSYLLSYFRGNLLPCKGKTIRKDVAGHIPDLFYSSGRSPKFSENF